MDDLIGGMIVLSLTYVLILIAMVVCIFISVGVLADRYGRNVGGYVLLSFLVTPLVVLLLLFCLGETLDKKNQRLEREYRLMKALNEGESLRETSMVNYM
jgi:hypothetical protein